MARDDGAGAGSVVLAFLVGAVAGAAVALLYAPADRRGDARVLSEKRAKGATARPGRPNGAARRSGRAREPDRARSTAGATRFSRPGAETPREHMVGRVLGVIAVATLATAVVQIWLLVAAERLARQMGRFVDDLDTRHQADHRPSQLGIARRAHGRPPSRCPRSSASMRSSRTSRRKSIRRSPRFTRRSSPRPARAAHGSWISGRDGRDPRISELAARPCSATKKTGSSFRFRSRWPSVVRSSYP